jgi:hypothetical protein
LTLAAVQAVWDQSGEVQIIKKLALAVFAAGIFTSGAMAAEYYVVRRRAPRSARSLRTSQQPQKRLGFKSGRWRSRPARRRTSRIAVICKEKN